MRELKASDLATLAAVCLVPVMLCCREHRQTFEVDLPANFSGTVQVSCAAYGGEVKATPVGANGRGVAPVCVKEDVDVLVRRNGQNVDTGDSLKWEKTGDGVPVQLTFTTH